MKTITLPSELEHAIEQQAQLQGTTVELLAVDGLRGLFLTPTDSREPTEGQTMADFFEDFIGSIHSGEVVPDGANLSENTGHKFAKLLRDKHAEGNR